MSKQNHIEEIETRIYTGSLMTPEDVVAALTDRPAQERQKIGSRWMFCCDVISPMFEKMRNQRLENFAMRTTGFLSSLGGAYGVLTHEVDGYQHRLLLPLYDAEVRRAVTCAAHEPFGFLMGNDNQTESLLLFGQEATGQDMQGLLGLSTELSCDALEVLIAELPDAVMAMTEMGRIPSLYDEPVRGVSLSVILPVHSMLRVDETLAETG